MAKITITFLEENGVPIELEIPQETGDALDLYVEEQNALYRTVLPPKENPEDPDPPVPAPKYTGKADLFLQHTLKTLIEPIVTKFGPQVAQNNAALLQQIAALEIQKKDLQEQLANTFKPKFLTGATGAV